MIKKQAIFGYKIHLIVAALLDFNTAYALFDEVEKSQVDRLEEAEVMSGNKGYDDIRLPKGYRMTLL